MPEIAEVARAVHYLRKFLVGRTVANVTAVDDKNVYGKVGTSGAEFEKHVTGKKIIDAGQQGKYFWMIMSSPPHPVMHFGMNGWFQFKSEHSFYYRPKKRAKDDEWPPRAWKFHLETKPEKGKELIEAAFVDTRRFARIRLVDCPGDKIRQYSPLKENGPDPVQDKDILTVEWLTKKCRSKKVPIKAMLLDQANISGIGNWVGDEIMFHAKMHPEQYAYTLTDEQIEQLHKSIHYICGTAVDLLADSEQFPKDWLFKHRWGKGKTKGKKTLPTGEEIMYLTVGGRTSAVVPSLQKNTGPVAKDMSEAQRTGSGSEEEEKPKPSKSKKRKADDQDHPEEESKPVKRARGRKAKPEVDDEVKEEPKPTTKAKAKPKAPAKTAKDKKDDKSANVNGKSKPSKTRNSAVKTEGSEESESEEKVAPAKAPPRNSKITKNESNSGKKVAPAKNKTKATAQPLRRSSRKST